MKQDLDSISIRLIVIDVEKNKKDAIEYGYKGQGLPFIVLLDEDKNEIAVANGLHMRKQLLNLINSASSNEVIKFYTDSSGYKVGNKYIEISNKPIIKNGRALLPLRNLANSLGITDSDIRFNEGIVSIYKETNIIEYMLGAKAIRINDDFFDIDSEPEYIGGVIYVDANSLPNALGYDVKSSGNSIEIYRKQSISSYSGINPEEIILQGVTYYRFEEMFELGGVSTFEYFFEKEDLLILKEGFKYKAVLLNDKINLIYLIDNENNYYKYDLEYKPLLKDGVWLVRGDNDAVRIGMLATLIR